MANELPHGRAPARAVSPPAVIASSATAAWLLVAGIVLLAVAIRIWLTRRIPAPWIMGDELLYSSLAKSFSEHQEMGFRQLSPWPFLSSYPVVVSPAWLAGSMDSTYAIVKAMNAVLMSLVAIPMYIWARRLVSPVYAVLVVVLVLLMPIFVYVNEVMTENLAFPVVISALFVDGTRARASDDPGQVARRSGRSCWHGDTATGARAVIVLPTAIVLKVLLDARAEPLRRWLATCRERSVAALSLVLIAGGVLAYAGYKAVQGGSVHELSVSTAASKRRATGSRALRVGRPSTWPSSAIRSA